LLNRLWFIRVVPKYCSLPSCQSNYCQSLYCDFVMHCDLKTWACI
jgi:hypothetical protein